MSRIRYGEFCLFVLFVVVLQNSVTAAEPDYPRTMAIAISIPMKYDDPAVQKNLSRADVLVLGFWPHWKEYKNINSRSVVQAIKRLNSNILVGQYTILNEAKGSENPDKTSVDIANKLDQEKWWLIGSTRSRVQHTSEFGAWDINFTKFSRPDKNNKRFPEWLAERNYLVFFKNTPEFDFWFLDVTVPQPPIAVADWENKGMPTISALPSYAKAYREGHVAYWNAIRNTQPRTLLIGNAPDLSSDEYKGQLNGALLEAAMGLSWSLYERKGWEAVRQQYYELMRDTKAPKLVGFNVWGAADDYQKMRFGLTTCLLNDGYYSYTDKKKEYDIMPWFDEYDVSLGKPLEAPPETPWKDGIYRRLYENGLVLVNPTKNAAHVTLEKTYYKIKGGQAPEINSGNAVQTLELNKTDGIILLSNGTPPSAPKITVSPSE